MKRNLKTLLLAVTAGALMTMAAGAMAQAPAGGPGAGPPRGAGGPGGGFGGPVDRASTIQRNALGDASLKLTDAQKAEIDKAADAYVAEVQKIPAAAAGAPPGPPSPEVMAARTKARENLTAAVNKVLNDEQKKTWEALLAARRSPGGGFGGGGPGGAPGGARPPGQ